MAVGHAFFLVKQKSLSHINKLQLLILLLLSLFVHGIANKFKHKNKALILDYSTKQNVHNLNDPYDSYGPKNTHLFLGSVYSIQTQFTHIAPDQYGPIQTQTYDPIGLIHIQLKPGQTTSILTQIFIPFGTQHIPLTLGQIYPTQTQKIIPSGPPYIILRPGQLYPIPKQKYNLFGTTYQQLTRGKTNSILTQTLFFILSKDELFDTFYLTALYLTAFYLNAFYLTAFYNWGAWISAAAISREMYLFLHESLGGNELTLVVLVLWIGLVHNIFERSITIQNKFYQLKVCTFWNGINYSYYTAIFTINFICFNVKLWLVHIIINCFVS